MEHINYNRQPTYFNIGFAPIIGYNVRLVNTFMDCAEQITIEDNVFFGHDVMLLTGSHDYELVGVARMSSIKNKPIIIREGAWICSRAVILQGVTIGKNAVVAAGSVVRDDVPEGVMVSGVPAQMVQVIKYKEEV